MIRLIRPAFAILAGVFAMRAFSWHWRGGGRFLLDRYPLQARRNLAGRGWFGMSYFGWILGTSLATQMTTPLVQALAVLAAIAGWPFGVAVGVGLGLARSISPWSGALALDGYSSTTVIRRFASPVRSFRSAGLLTSLALLGVDVTWWRI
jgi:hypothetical protein